MAKRRTPPTALDDPTMRRLVGGTLLDRLDDETRAPLRIGRRCWTTHRLAIELGVVNTIAARRLTAAADSIGATSVRDLYKRSSPYTFAGIAGLGETAMYVLWRLFQSEGLDPDVWAASGDRDDALVSFHTMKRREQKAEQRTRDEARKRTGRRRATLRELDAAAATA